ncbi:MAG: alpha/beta hydrolase [Polynucleobacter sp.]|nr:alpha/beta hydrolase [Polynucleobacter sp.]
MQRMAELRRGLPNRYTLAFPESRAQLLFERTPWLADGPPCHTVDGLVNYDDRSFGRRLVIPREVNDRHLLVYLHGGGWCVGSSATHDNIVRRLAAEMRCVAWSIDYALAPEAPYPAGQLDCIAAIQLAAQQHPSLRLVVAGDSAGAHLALSAALQLRDNCAEIIDSLLLFYGVYTDACDDASMRAYGDGRYGLSIAAHERYLRACFGLDRAESRSKAFALHDAVDLRGLPRVYLTVAELDILRDQSYALVEKLQIADVSVDVHELPGVIHGFLSFGQQLPQAAEALSAAARWAVVSD